MFDPCVTSMYYFYLFKSFVLLFFFFWKAMLQRGQVKEELNIFHMLVHSLNGHNEKGWANPKPGTRSFIQASHMGAEAQDLGHFLCFPRCLSREMGQRRSYWGLNWYPCGMLALQMATYPVISQCLSLFIKILEWFISLKNRKLSSVHWFILQLAIRVGVGHTGVSSSFWVFYMGPGAHVLVPSSAGFLGSWAGNWIGSGTVGTQTGVHMLVLQVAA